MIRNGKLEDLEQIAKFDKFGGDRQQEIECDVLKVFVREHRVVAYISIACYGFHDSEYITFLAVQPDFRRRGIGTTLIQEIEKISRFNRILISTEEWNIPMLNLLAKLGFSKCGSIDRLNTDGSQELFFIKQID